MGVVAAAPEGQKSHEGEYVKACPDYKRYSMFMQYVFSDPPKTATNLLIVNHSHKEKCNCHSNGPPSTVELSPPPLLRKLFRT
jgi:hypothetical protein